MCRTGRIDRPELHPGSAIRQPTDLVGRHDPNILCSLAEHWQCDRNGQAQAAPPRSQARCSRLSTGLVVARGTAIAAVSVECRLDL